MNTDQLRKNFENWAIHQHIYSFHMYGDEYADYTTECAWRAYCTGAAHALCRDFSESAGA